MQTLKIILGAILGITGFSVFIEMVGEESGAGLFGAFTGFLIMEVIAGLLIYSGIKGNEKKKL